MPDLDKVKRALEHAMRVTVGEPIRHEIEAAIAELELIGPDKAADTHSP